MSEQDDLLAKAGYLPTKKDPDVYELQGEPKETDLRLGFVGYETIGITVFNKKAVEYLCGPPPWPRRLYWWWKDVKKDFSVRWHQWTHKKYFKNMKKQSGRIYGNQCTKCKQWNWREM
jgi:hypothetical protein